jgi:rubredoxin
VRGGVDVSLRSASGVQLAVATRRPARLRGVPARRRYGRSPSDTLNSSSLRIAPTVILLLPAERYMREAKIMQILEGARCLNLPSEELRDASTRMPCGVLRRGLAPRCSICEHTQFQPIDKLVQRWTCRRCDSPNDLNSKPGKHGMTNRCGSTMRTRWADTSFTVTCRHCSPPTSADARSTRASDSHWST